MLHTRSGRAHARLLRDPYLAGTGRGLALDCCSVASWGRRPHPSGLWPSPELLARSTPLITCSRLRRLLNLVEDGVYVVQSLGGNFLREATRAYPYPLYL